MVGGICGDTVVGNGVGSKVDAAGTSSRANGIAMATLTAAKNNSTATAIQQYNCLPDHFLSTMFCVVLGSIRSA